MLLSSDRKKILSLVVLGSSLIITSFTVSREVAFSLASKISVSERAQQSDVTHAEMISPMPAKTVVFNAGPSTQLSAKNVNSSLWDDLSRELRLDHKTQTSSVQSEIRKLLADQDKLYSVLQSAIPYLYFIHQEIVQRGLPAELALIPVIESEFNPYDHSKKGATGLWQLMPGTAHELGVNVRSSYDGRRNVIASTKAALAYFNDLGNSFNGNWYLAIAAYNCGQAKIEWAERKMGSHNFWSLPLPRETKCYVPRLLAIAAIIKNPEKYGVQLPPIKSIPYFAELKINKPVNLEKISKSAGINMDTLRRLNPDYGHSPVPKSKGLYSVLVPANKAAAVKQVIT